jgi:hypothetical protein
VGGVAREPRMDAPGPQGAAVTVYCPACAQQVTDDGTGVCMWCDGPTDPPKRVTKPAGVYGLLRDHQLRALHRIHIEGGVSLNELGRRVWERAGYAGPRVATEGIRLGWRRLGLTARDRLTAVRASNRARATGSGPEHRRALRIARGETIGVQCAGTIVGGARCGEPCRLPAVRGSRYCVVHDPARAREVADRLARARATQATRRRGRP